MQSFWHYSPTFVYLCVHKASKSYCIYATLSRPSKRPKCPEHCPNFLEQGLRSAVSPSANPHIHAYPYWLSDLSTSSKHILLPRKQELALNSPTTSTTNVAASAKCRAQRLSDVSFRMRTLLSQDSLLDCFFVECIIWSLCISMYFLYVLSPDFIQS